MGDWDVHVAGYRFRRFVRGIPRPVLALGPRDLYSVIVHGTGFTLPIAGHAPAIGFYTTRIVAARDAREAQRLAISAVEREWRRRGRDPAILEIEEIQALGERFRLRRGGGATFYSGDDGV